MGLTLRPEPYLGRALTAGSAVIAAPFATVLGPNDGQFGPWVGNSPYEGWAADYSSQPTISSPVPFTNSRQGFDATGAATTYLDTMYVTSAVRQPAPNDGTQSANTAALSDYIYSTDTPSGSVTNNSTITSPKPIAKWGRPGRTVVGNSITLGVLGFHRNAREGKQVACVVFSLASAGSGTATATVATPTVLGYINDRFAVVEYVATVDITSFTDATAFTVDAVVYPWIGAGTTSQRRTVDGTATNYWDFATQTHLKHTSRAANPPLVYVNSSTGVDATVNASGVDGSSNQKVSTTHATAAAVPFQTTTSAFNALKAATGLTGGFTDGCEVRIQNSTVPWAAPTSGTYQSVAEAVLTRDPDYARSACILTIGAAAVGTQHNWLKVKDLTFQRVGANVLNFTNQLVIQDCNFDNGSQGGAITANAARTIHVIGNTITNWASGVFGGSTNPAGIIRGNTATGGTMEGNCFIGNLMQGTTLVYNSGRVDNSIVAFNKVHTITGIFDGLTGMDVTGHAVVQNQLEWLTATTNPIMRYNADAAANNCTHFVMFNNTYAGAFGGGRHNIFYDENGTARRHKLIAHKGDICTQVNVKIDMFDWYNDLNQSVNPSPRLGAFAYYYGVGCESNWFQYKVASAPTEAQIYAGAGSSVGTSTTVPLMATSNWTAFKSVTYNGTTYSTALGGNGTYTLNAGSPLAGAMLRAVLSHDAAGTARPTTGATIGAYEGTP